MYGSAAPVAVLLGIGMVRMPDLVHIRKASQSNPNVTLKSHLLIISPQGVLSHCGFKAPPPY